MDMTALTGTVAPPLAGSSGGLGAAWWLRSILSLLLAAAILAVALPAAFGAGIWNGGVDTGQFFAHDAQAHLASSPAHR